ncbi:zinc ribbon domain-containing protein [Trichormus azollae]|uniref:zinc ribbon domain-containing protein n=1 Tax=Trichormus azollae TaxID=1164 RepID=UPI00325FB4DA
MWMVHIVSNLSEGKSYRKEIVLKCGHCGFENNADINAAMNIGALGKTYRLPQSLGMSCQLKNCLCS